MNRTPIFLVALSLSHIASAMGFKYANGEEGIYFIMFLVFCIMDTVDFFRSKK